MSRYLKIFWLGLFFLAVFSHWVIAEETLSWHDCIKEAAKNHPDLIAAEQEVIQSQATKKITASTLYPQLNTNLNASTAKTSSATSSSTLDNYSYGLSLSQLVFDGTKTINNVKAAAENITARKENFRFTSSQIRFRLKSAFVNLLRAQEMLRISEEIYNIRRGNLELITLRYQSGLEHKGALLQAEADLADAMKGIAQTKRELEVAQRDLVKETGRRQLTPIKVKGDFTIKDTVKQKPDFASLAQNNPSLQQVIAQKNSAEFGLRSAYANFAPVLSGQAGTNRSGAHWTPHGDQWNLGLTLSMPVFEGGLRFAQVSQAKGLLNQLKENERSTRDGIVLTLEQTWAALQDAIDNVQVQNKRLIATEERSRIAQAEYSVGFIGFDNWTIIEDNLVTAKKAFLNAQADALVVEADWIQAKGETLEYE